MLRLPHEKVPVSLEELLSVRLRNEAVVELDRLFAVLLDAPDLLGGVGNGLLFRPLFDLGITGSQTGLGRNP